MSSDVDVVTHSLFDRKHSLSPSMAFSVFSHIRVSSLWLSFSHACYVAHAISSGRAPNTNRSVIYANMKLKFQTRCEMDCESAWALRTILCVREMRYAIKPRLLFARSFPLIHFRSTLGTGALIHTIVWCLPSPKQKMQSNRFW